MRFTRRRSDRPDASPRGLASRLETLESRVQLSQTAHPFAVYLPSDLKVTNPITHSPISFHYQQLIHDSNPQSPFFSNQGKVVSGKDRQGDEWTITVHGPGSVIVTDTSPNDGELDDPIDTITLVGTSPTKTYVTGTTTQSFRTQTDGTIQFNRLVDNDGVKSVVLNGFTLTQTIAPTNGVNYSNTGIFLNGGVGLLQFHNIQGVFNTATTYSPINIVIGSPTKPTGYLPTIRLDEIFNTVFNGNATSVPTTPQTTPTVNILVNGQLHGLEIVSSTQSPTIGINTATLQPTYVAAGNQFLLPNVGATGRTAVRTESVDHLSVRGTARNFTVSKAAVPFQNDFTGVSHIGTATFYGNADAVGLDATNGTIGKVVFYRGLGSPVGAGISAARYGTPFAETGYPASGLVGGLVTARKIGTVGAGAANTVTQTASNPDFVQLHETGTATTFPQPGNALTSAAIVSSGSIGKVHIKGDQVNSEIKSGFHYPSFYAGLEGTRAPSKIGKVRQQGNMVNGVTSATYRPGNQVYDINAPGQVAGPGTITGKMTATDATYVTGALTPLGNQGAGFYARHKKGGYLPPPSLPTRPRNGVQIR